MKTVLVIIALVFAGVAYYFYAAKTKAEAEHQTKISTISDEKESEISHLKGTYTQLEARLKNEIEQGQIKIVQLSDRLSVIMVDKVLFPSGEAEITPEGLKVLERIGDVLKEAKNKIIRVEGYTDNVQIDKRLQKKYPTNWELSTARATNVVRFLQEKIGIDGGLLQPIGMSEYHPIASNETPEGRSQNRRIEISLLP
ncbi:MAG: hypothetical protein EHM64_16225 [Ignavibacteriae bacterium]|nr:MAG: hypothetical protein EHM64_16225 [Ignavibacteriota bacterium]